MSSNSTSGRVHRNILQIHQDKLTSFKFLASTLPTEKAKLASLEAEIKTIHELISTESKMIENQVKEEMLNAKPSRAAKSQPKLPLDFDITKAKSWHKTPKWIAYENQIWKLQQEIKQQTKRIKDIETRTAEIEYELQSCVWLNLYHTTIVDYDKKIRDLARSLQQARNLNTNASPNPGSESASVSSSIMNTLLASNRHSTVEEVNREHQTKRTSSMEAQLTQLKNQKQREINRITLGYIQECCPELQQSLASSSSTTGPARSLLNQIPNSNVECICGGTITQERSGAFETVCTTCGAVQAVSAIGVSYRELCDSKQTSTSYKHLNHCREYLRQIQGISRAHIDDNIIHLITSHLEKQQTPRDKVAPHIIRDILKRERLNDKFGEKVVQITRMIYPQYPAPQIEVEHEEIICQRFLMAIPPFEKHKHEVNPKRKSFISYPYICYQICRIEGWDHYLDYFSLLKAEPKLAEQDRFWYAVCKELGWPFYRVIGNVEGDTRFDLEMDTDM